jgi:dipeptidyl aminopeptidase/acylaminoacyl peptidase
MKRSLISIASIVLAQSISAQTTPPPLTPLAAAAPLTINSFAATPFIEKPQLSPNGRYLATRLSVRGDQLLALFSLFDRAEKPTVVNTGGDDAKVDVDWWRWVNDDWLLIGISAIDAYEGDKFRVSRLLSMNRTTGKLTQLVKSAGGQNASNVIWTARDGTPRIMVAAQAEFFLGEGFWPEVMEIDVSNGHSKSVVKPREGVFNYYADAQGAVRMGYGYNDESRTGRLLYRSSGRGSFSTIDRADFKKDETLNVPDLFLAAKDQALTISSEEGFSAVYDYDLATLKRGKKIYGLSGYDIDGLIETPTGDGVAGVALTENAARVQWLDAGLAATQSDLDKAVGAGRAYIASWSQDQQSLLVKVGGPDQAGAYFLYNRATGGSMRRVGFADEGLKMRRFAPVTTIRYKARDGLEIAAVLTLPNGRRAKDLPLILLPHGGPAARDEEQWDWWVQFLAWRGYAVVQPNYRGSTGYGRAFYKKGDGEWGLKMQDDLNDAVTSLAAQGIVDPKRVCIVGASYGGYAALRGAQRDGGLFRCAISFAGVSDMAAITRYDSQFLYGNTYKADLKKKALDFAAVSPIKHAEQFGTPTLLVHGKADLTVPVDQSRNMASKLKAAGKVYRYIEQPLADHHFSRQADRLQFLQEMQAWLDKYNPPDAG